MDTAIADGNVKRTIGARVPHFSCVPDLLARTDMLATLPLLLSEELLERSNLRAVEPPLPIAPVPMSYFWSFRLTNDPGARWIHAQLLIADVIGINFEDRVVQGGGLYAIDRQASRVAVVRDTARKKGVDLFINARTDLFFGKGDPAQLIDEALDRANAYAAAGASGFLSLG